MRAILIPEHGEPEVVEQDGLADLQRHLGGCIEAVALPGRRDAVAYINEAGKHRLGPNEAATALLRDGLLPGDHIAGPCLIVGIDPVEGEVGPVPEDLPESLGVAMTAADNPPGGGPDPASTTTEDGAFSGLPLERPVVLVTPLGGAPGARPAAAALACAGVGAPVAPLFLDLGGRAPRPTLLAAGPAQRLEERLAETFPGAAVAARGGVCHVGIGTDRAGLAMIGAVLDAAPRSPVVIHVEEEGLRALLAAPDAGRISAALVLGEAGIRMALAVPTLLDLLDRDLVVVLLRRRLGWLEERRAMFGALSVDELVGFPPAPLAWFAGHAMPPSNRRVRSTRGRFRP